MREETLKIDWDENIPQRLNIEGSITYANCLFAKERIDLCFANSKKESNLVVINCSMLEELDGSGLGVIVNLYLTLQRWGVKLCLHNLLGQPKELITFLDIHHFFEENKKCHYPSALQSA